MSKKKILTEPIVEGLATELRKRLEEQEREVGERYATVDSPVFRYSMRFIPYEGAIEALDLIDAGCAFWITAIDRDLLLSAYKSQMEFTADGISVYGDKMELGKFVGDVRSPIPLKGLADPTEDNDAVNLSTLKGFFVEPAAEASLLIWGDYEDEAGQRLYLSFSGSSGLGSYIQAPNGNDLVLIASDEGIPAPATPAQLRRGTRLNINSDGTAYFYSGKTESHLVVLGGIGTPVAEDDAANKKYVDDLVGDINAVLDQINGEVV